MKRLEQLLIRSRAAARSARTRLPGAAAAMRPSRLVLRLNDLRLAPGLVRATGEPMGAAEWQSVIVRFIQWLGPVRVTIAGGEPARSPLLDELVRFANRLECPTHLVTGGGIDPARAELLVDRGLGAVTILVGGVDEGTHRAAVGSTLADATGSLDALRDARARRGRPLGLYVGVPLTAENVASVGAVGGWARQAGADGVLATLPLGEEVPPGAAEAVAALGRDNLTPEHLKAWLEGRQVRVRGGLRAEILSDGTLLVSSHVAPLGDVRRGDIPAIWAAADEPLRAVLAHPRPWDEVELVPRALVSSR
ncbi:MAG: hypothetical protein H6739_25885 [Alphaproteobacteria bacterium]|nr:hypothetical protein [Alphaproteobacteria bacterium]